MSLLDNIIEIDKLVKDNKDKIRYILGITGTISAGITGVVSGMRIQKKIDSSDHKLSKKELIKISAKELVPVCISVGGSVTAQTINFIDLNRRINSATTAIVALSSQIDKVKQAEKEVVGEDKAKEIQKKASEQPDPVIFESPSGCYWFKDFYTNAEFYTTEAAIEKGIGNINEFLKVGDASINDYCMGIDKKDGRDTYSELGEYIGWKCGTRLRARYGDGQSNR